MVRFGNDDDFSLRNWIILLEEHQSMIHSWVLEQTPGGIYVKQSNYARDVIDSLEKIYFPTDSYRVMMYWDEGEFDMNNTYWRKFLSAEKTDVYILGGSFDREYRYPNQLYQKGLHSALEKAFKAQAPVDYVLDDVHIYVARLFNLLPDRGLLDMIKHKI